MEELHSFEITQTVTRLTVGSRVPILSTVDREIEDPPPLPLVDANSTQPKKYINGVSFPTKEPREIITLHTEDCLNVAAIDFGTTCCSVAYFIGGTKSGVKFLKIDNREIRAKTAILMDGEGKVIDFGRRAHRKYSQFLTDEKKRHCEYHYFNDIKMALQHDKEVSRNTTIKSIQQKEFYLVEVIALILKFLKEKLLNLEEICKGLTGALKASHFAWVITVPAMWKARGKQMMREAAYMAGIANEDNIITKLTMISGTGANMNLVDRKFSHSTSCTKQPSLSLALEPEAAALYCIEHAKQKNSPCATSSCYMVLDIGGGTVDITAHKVTSGAVEVILPPSGNNWGGKRVNENFKEFLGSLINDNNFDKYQAADTSSKNSVDLDFIVHQLFEDQKQLFGDREDGEDEDDEAIINLPYSFMTTYKDDLKKGIERLHSPDVVLSDCDLVISRRKMEEFFSEAVEEISSCVSTCITELERKHKVEAIFFVGGFGGSKFLHSKVKKTLDSSIDTYCPEDHEVAVVAGAILFQQNPAIIKSRVADATYGSQCIRDYNPRIHNPEYLIYDDDNQKNCNHLLLPFVLKGDIIHAEYRLAQTLTPFKHLQRNMHFDIYTSLSRSIKYVCTSDRESIPDVHKIGKLTVRMPDTRQDKDRQVKLVFDFSHTEIQIEAFDLTSGEQASTTVDFLSDLS